MKKVLPSDTTVELEVSSEELKINGVGIQFVRYKDEGDTYNFGAVKDDVGEKAKILDILHNEQTNSFCLKTNFFDVFFYKQGNLITFKIEWENEFTNRLWQVKFNLENPVEKTFSEDMNSIIERRFDPLYDMRKNLPKERGIEAKTNFAPMQRYVGAQGFGIITKGLNEYEVQENSILITLLRSVGVISNPKNPSRSTPAGPPLEVPSAQQIGYNYAEFSIGFFEPEEYEKYVSVIYPQII